MTKDEITYTAIITITLPEAAGATQAHIRLTPPDTVSVDGRILPLRDCTLADLQAAAAELEAEVWQAYQAIKLVDLSETVDVEVNLLDKEGQPVHRVENWRQQKVILPPAAETEPTSATENTDAALEPETKTAVPHTEIPLPSTATDDEPEPAATEPEEETAVPAEVKAEETVANEAGEEAADEGGESAQVETAVTADEPEPAVAEPEPTPDDEKEPEVTVSEAEPVFPDLEISDEDVAAESAKPRAYPTPAIAPSEARVRIAGRRSPAGMPTWAAVDILIDEPALRSAQAHALSSPDREVAGVLVGPRPEKQPDGRYVVHIIDTIIAKYTVMHGASVTYTPESWRYLNDKLGERYPEETAVMAGWYHTHPGFGIFLSGMDQFIHQNFFTQIWHVALVLDPLARKSGFFCWDRQQRQVKPVPFSWPDWAEHTW